MSEVARDYKIMMPLLPYEHDKAQGEFSAFGHTAIYIPEVAELAKDVLSKRNKYFGRPHKYQPVLGQYANGQPGVSLQGTPLGDLCELVSRYAPVTTTGPDLLPDPVQLQELELARSAADELRIVKSGIIAVVGLEGTFKLRVQETSEEESDGIQTYHPMLQGDVAYLGEQGVRYQVVSGNIGSSVSLTIAKATPLPQPATT